MTSAGEPVRPLLTVVRGEPTPEQLAALVSVVLARSTAGQPAQTSPRSPWSQPVLRTPLIPGPGRWRGSALPG